MIDTFRHKGLRRLFEKDDHGGVRSDMVPKLRQIFSALEAANGPEDMALPLFRFDRLTGDRRASYSVTVKANWRITFQFEEGLVCDVDLEDYH